MAFKESSIRPGEEEWQQLVCGGHSAHIWMRLDAPLPATHGGGIRLTASAGCCWPACRSPTTEEGGREGGAGGNELYTDYVELE